MQLISLTFSVLKEERLTDFNALQYRNMCPRLVTFSVLKVDKSSVSKTSQP